MTVVVKRVNVKTSKVRKLLVLPGLVVDVAFRAEKVKIACEAAGIRVEGIPGRIELPVTVQVNTGRRRARARVILDHPAGQAVEAKHALLATSIDAARD